MRRFLRNVIRISAESVPELNIGLSLRKFLGSVAYLFVNRGGVA